MLLVLNLRVEDMYAPITGCTGLRPDNLAYNPEFECTMESTRSTGPWNYFEMGSGIPNGPTHNTLPDNARS